MRMRIWWGRGSSIRRR